MLHGPLPFANARRDSRVPKMLPHRFFPSASFSIWVDGKLQLSRSFEKPHFEKEEESYAEGGDFLPLSVWATKGFDSTRIEQLSRPEDIEDHAVLGRTYRVVIKSKAVKRSYGSVQSDIATAAPSSASNYEGLSLRELIEKQKAESKKKAKHDKEEQARKKSRPLCEFSLCASECMWCG